MKLERTTILILPSLQEVIQRNLVPIFFVSGCLSDLHDDLRISLYDEVVENQMNDDTAIKNVDIYQRIQNNWLGEYRIPINALLAQQKVFENLNLKNQNEKFLF